VSAEVPRVDEQAREASAQQSRTLAPFERRALTVIANEPLGAYRVLKVADPRGPAPQAGQFAMLAAAERWGAGEDERPYLPRAFSYARWLAGRSELPPPSDRRQSFRSPIGGEAHFLLEDVGPGTCRLCELRAGEQLWVLGPLGNGFTAPESERRALLVGGGVGIAPLAIWQDALNASGEHATVLLGFRDGTHAVGADLLTDSRLASDDGSVGHHGLVTDLLREEIDRDERIVVYACGPPPMLEAVRALCAEHSVPVQLALEAGMACGFGACYGCVVPRRGGGYLRVCVDGPVVDATQLDHVQGAPDHRV
jgi:dihydroorotate dehydrogenase electron transfer subunit